MTEGPPVNAGGPPASRKERMSQAITTRDHDIIRARAEARGGHSSSVIARFRYLREKRVLEIVFQTGNIYHYLDVPASVHDGLRDASSKGEFFNAHIRDHFDFKRIADGVG
jgi:lysyl-tRNA synthetase class 2